MALLKLLSDDSCRRDLPRSQNILICLLLLCQGVTSLNRSTFADAYLFDIDKDMRLERS